jgi:saccharopine dehydrogenase (NAD+, L-lysine-forming)
MTHLWVRAEERPHEARVGLTPEGAAALIAPACRHGRGQPRARDPDRRLPRRRGTIAAPGSWRTARATPSSSA